MFFGSLSLTFVLAVLVLFLTWTCSQGEQHVGEERAAVLCCSGRGVCGHEVCGIIVMVVVAEVVAVVVVAVVVAVVLVLALVLVLVLALVLVLVLVFRL